MKTLYFITIVTMLALEVLADSEANYRVTSQFGIRDPNCAAGHVRKFIDNAKHCIPCDAYKETAGEDWNWKKYCVRE